MILGDQMLKIQLGSSLLYVFSTITGRVISDVGLAQKELKAKNEELVHTNEELDHFVYSVSHDLSSPLKSILGLVNISRIDQPSENKALYLKKIEESVHKLETFIGEILDYSHNKRSELTIEQINLKALCSEILENLKYADNFRKVKLELSVHEEDNIYSNRPRLKMILNNLLSNAVKFQNSNENVQPFVRVTSYKKDGGVIVTIEDNGEGIRAEYQPKIFEMFFRGTDKFKGSGLGLYIAKEAADRIHGRISVHSEYGKGSTFSLELKNLSSN
jgi:signal transduction histidine kinase